MQRQRLSKMEHVANVTYQLKVLALPFCTWRARTRTKINSFRRVDPSVMEDSQLVVDSESLSDFEASESDLFLDEE